MPLPPLHVDGRYLKDDCGNTVLLHGVAITPHPWFNGCQYGFNSQYCTWDNYDVEGALRYNFAVMDRLTDTTDGFYLNYIRLHVDPYWSNEPGPPIPEHDISRFNYERLVKYTNEVIIPIVNHARSRGMYVILRPPGVCPHRIAVGDSYHEYLKTVWQFLSDHQGLKNIDHVMFELANEPVQILGTNGVWGTIEPPHFEALKNFFQPITDLIRNNGADNIIWIPGTGWQSHYAGYVDYPIEGDNIGYAVHVYPGYWGGIRNYEAFRKGWDEHVKPIADIAPIVVTETDWAPEGYGAFGIGNTGVAGGEGFGANLNLIFNQSGNVSWNLLAPDNFLHNGDPNGEIAYNNDWEACAAPVKYWFAQNAKFNNPEIVCNKGVELENFGIYEIEFQTDPGRVLEVRWGQDFAGAAAIPGISNGSASQRWQAIHLGNDLWRFVSMNSASRRSLEASGGHLANGTDIRLADTKASDAQTWKVIPVENGNYRILSISDPTKSWNIAQCNMDGGNGLQLYDVSDVPCQYFKFNLTGREIVTGLPSNDISGGDVWRVFPNPSENANFNISIQSDNITEFNIQIVDIQGRLVFEKQMDQRTDSYVSTGLKSGFYLMTLRAGSYTKTERIVIP